MSSKKGMEKKEENISSIVLNIRIVINVYAYVYCSKRDLVVNKKTSYYTNDTRQVTAIYHQSEMADIVYIFCPKHGTSWKLLQLNPVLG